MKTIYSSFDDFSKRNQSILNIISDKDDIDLLRAIWDARDGEILKLEMRLQRQLKEEASKEQKAQEQIEVSENLANEIKHLKNCLSKYEEVNKDNQGKLNNQSNTIQILENDLSILSTESDQLEKILLPKTKKLIDLSH